MAVVTFTIIDEDDRHFGARYTGQSSDPGTPDFILNNAVILKSLEQVSTGVFSHHDRWEEKYHAPKPHDKRTANNRDDDHERMNVHSATENKRLKYNIVQYTSDPDQNQHV